MPTQEGDLIRVPSHYSSRTLLLIVLGILAVVIFGVVLAYTLAFGAILVPAFVATAAPFVILFLLARPRTGLYVVVFTAPYVDVLKTTALGVTFRFNEVFGLLLFIVTIFYLMRTHQRLNVGMVDVFIAGLLGVMLTSILANLGNLPNPERLKQVPTAWTDVTGELDRPEFARYKTIMLAMVSFAAYFSVNNLVRTWTVWRRCVKLLMISSMLVCVWALLNLLGFLGGMGSGLGLQASNVWYKAGEAPRITGTLSEPSYFANFLVLVIPVAFFSYALRTVLIGRRLDLLAVVLLCGTLVFTFSGGGWVVFAFELGLLFLVCLRHRLPLSKFVAMIAALAILASMALMAAALFTDVDYARLADDNWKKVEDLFTSGVGSGRRIAPDVGWMMFCDNPIIGVGPGMFQTFEYDYLIKLGFEGEAPSSTFYARVMGELGGCGLVMVLGIFLAATWTSLRWAKRASHPPTQAALWGMGVSFVAIAFHYLAHANFWWPYVWVMFGLAASGVRIARRLTLAGAQRWEDDR